MPRIPFLASIRHVTDATNAERRQASAAKAAITSLVAAQMKSLCDDYRIRTSAAKAAFTLARYGTAKAVPLQKLKEKADFLPARHGG